MIRNALPLACALTLLASGPSLAQDDDLRAAVERYVDSPVQQRMMDEMLSADAMITQMAAMMPQLTEAQLEIVGRIGAEEMAGLRPALEAAMVEAAVETFTLPEILALEAFYTTPEGEAVMSKMQPFMATTFAMVGPEMQAAQMRIGQRVMTELSEQ
ncbi:MAG: DUF2059 domain-containing protein [Roseicyclus sp.]